MAKSNRSIKWSVMLWSSLGIQVLGFICIYTFLESNMSSSEKGNNGIVITAAHLDESEIPHNFLLMYKDIAKDTAYYLDTKHVLPTVSIQKVFIEGVDDAVIVDSKEGHFFVEVANTEQITAGLSGKRVYARDNKTVIGFVSQLTVDNQLLCRVLE